MGKELGSILQELRKSKNLTQQQVADYLGLKNRSTLGSWELGKTEPNIDFFTKLCDLYGIENVHYFTVNRDVREALKRESGIIAKYRELDAHGRELVEYVTLKEWERSYYIPQIVYERDELEGVSLLVGYLKSLPADALETMCRYAELLENHGTPGPSTADSQ